MSSPPSPRLLIVDDEPEMARVLADALVDRGFSVDVAPSARAALELFGKRVFELVLTDLRMEHLDGFDLLKQVKALDPDVPVLVMTAFGAIDSAITAMKLGAYHYITKPLRLDEVTTLVDRALDERRLRSRSRAFQRIATERSALGAMVGRTPAMQRVFDRVERLAQSTAPVLISGETGTGKELVARAIHFEGPRKAGPFVAINCTALPESLLESELFGHLKGAFTGATAARQGLFVEADGGTLLLDEIGDMPLPLQAKLLRVLEQRELRAVGSDEVRTVDVRVLAATHKDLGRLVQERAFREDLFYRLNVVAVTLPPLRERAGDIPALVERFFARARERSPSSPVTELAPALVSALAARDWPGNVRELENTVERIVVTGAGPRADVETLDAALADGPRGPQFSVERPLLVPLRQLEAEYIAWAISRCGGNKTRAAELLGIDVSTIHRRGKAGQGGEGG
ncbi:MAG: sigma-54-dependent Fis family transcriptional regulator [Archangiaceae bacterium]|nr:sigma-54-dependent Fis family transcriptional regulator [Archangiaceae bacterium]